MTATMTATFPIPVSKTPTGRVDLETSTIGSAVPEVGTIVTADYRVSSGQCWPKGHCWIGRVLAANDPLAWVGTLAFPQSTYDNPPSQAEVDAHIARIRAMYADLRKTHSNPKAYERDPFDPAHDVFVCWEFGKVYTAKTRSLIVLD